MGFEMKQRETNLENENRKIEAKTQNRNGLRELLQLPPGRERFRGNLAMSGQQRRPHGLALPHIVRNFIFCLALGLFAMGKCPFWTRTWELPHTRVGQYYMGAGA